MRISYHDVIQISYTLHSSCFHLHSVFSHCSPIFTCHLARTKIPRFTCSTLMLYALFSSFECINHHHSRIVKACLLKKSIHKVAILTEAFITRKRKHSNSIRSNSISFIDNYFYHIILQSATYIIILRER